MDRRSSRKDGNTFGLVMLFLAAESTAMMLQKWTLECMENMAALQNESGPPFSSCPGANFGRGGDRQPKEGEEGAKRLDGQRDPGGCAACAEWMQALGWQLAPASPGTGRVVVFFHPISSFGLHTRSRVSLSRREITSPRPALSTRLPELPLFSLLSSSHLSASTLAPAAHDQRHLTHFGNFTFFII